ncbi:hypothetical protein HanRHA438_Chr09g0414411 [Helianthus annuus]|nr:hypothetical protein HanRHA438_Chr09g0414411 [Helianthus annuus]
MLGERTLVASYFVFDMDFFFTFVWLLVEIIDAPIGSCHIHVHFNVHHFYLHVIYLFCLIVYFPVSLSHHFSFLLHSPNINQISKIFWFVEFA